MALTAFPVIVCNSGTGSDNNSGAGPGDGTTAGTIVTGTATATNSTTVTLTISTGSLSDVLQTGAHVIFITGLGYIRISTVDVGLGQIVVETAVTCAAANFAIGGKLAGINGSNARKLFAATSGPSTNFGASGRWTIEGEDDGAFAISSAITLAFTAGTGLLKVRGAATTLRQFVQSGNAALFACNTANRIQFEYIQFRHSNATKSAVFSTTAGVTIALFRCIVGDNGGTNCPLSCLAHSSGVGADIQLFRSAIVRVTGDGIGLIGSVRIFGSEISRCGGAGIGNTVGNGSIEVFWSIISHNTSYGVNNVGGTNVCMNSVVDHNGNTGWRATNAAPAITFLNNQFTANTGYGVEVANALSTFGVIEFNNFGNASDSTANSSGPTSLSASDTLSSSNTTIAPGYTDSSSSVRNYTIYALAKATGFPPSTETVGGGTSGTTSYTDIGLQRQEAAAGGTHAFACLS